MPISRLRRFNRRCRGYRNLYANYLAPAEILAAAEALGSMTTMKMTESQLSETKRHCCTMDKDYKFCVEDFVPPDAPWFVRQN